METSQIICHMEPTSHIMMHIFIKSTVIKTQFANNTKMLHSVFFFFFFFVMEAPLPVTLYTEK